MKRSIGMALVAIAAMAPVDAGGEAGGARAAGLWNPATVATVTATVEAVERIEMGSWACVRLRVRTAEGTLALRVAPDWFLAEKKIVFAKGERLQVTGSRLRFAGEAAMVAGEIVRDSGRIVLRDGAGRAAWTGR